jgi:ATP-binding cassette, subfamily B, bacterial PglK
MREAHPWIRNMDEDMRRLRVPQAPTYDHDRPLMQSTLACDNVSFGYEGGPPLALDNVSFTIERGQSVGIVGPTGAGKSTLVDILLGLLEPGQGRVLVDGADLWDVRDEWRQVVGYVPQSSYLMPTSVRTNVALGVDADKIDDEAVWAALTRASLRDVVEALPGQLDFSLGEAGSGVSGGQRQRLGIARALYHRPDVLILDEATSSLDVETEAEITQTLSQLTGLTKIVVAHRLSTVREADQVLFLRRGRLEASGRFEEVRRAVPDFARQVQLSGLTPEMPQPELDSRT